MCSPHHQQLSPDAILPFIICVWRECTISSSWKLWNVKHHEEWKKSSASFLIRLGKFLYFYFYRGLSLSALWIFTYSLSSLKISTWKWRRRRRRDLLLLRLVEKIEIVVREIRSRKVKFFFLIHACVCERILSRVEGWDRKVYKYPRLSVERDSSKFWFCGVQTV